MVYERKSLCSQVNKNKHCKRSLVKLGIIAIISAIWLAFKTGMRPTRIVYPCQQAALANIQLFKLAVLAALPSIASLRSKVSIMKPALILGVLIAGYIFATSNQIVLDFQPKMAELDDFTRVPISLIPQSATSLESASDLFFIQNVTGLEGNTDTAINELFDLMETNGLYFYKTETRPEGLIGNNDVVIIKMNSQWEYRGGTNTDLIKGVINALINHPSGFTGEVIIADNGQGTGNLDRSYSNAYYYNQSAQELANQFFPIYNVSVILWDNLRESTVDDYDEDDFTDGYVRSSTWHEDVQLYVSYPKFRSPATGACISFKNGIWSNATGFNSESLKVINMPVLKTHELYGVTASVKHYMGVPQGHVVPSVSDFLHEHYSVALGGMGTLMAETRFPILNILDMIWINPHPLESSRDRGPWSRYHTASFTDIIGVSLDPVALDYWSAKNILMPTAIYYNYSDYSSLDPDYEPISEHIYYPSVQMEESFHNYLERSMIKLKEAGYQVTMNQTEMNVFVTTLPDRPIIPITPTASTTPTTPTTTNDTGLVDQTGILLVVITPIAVAIVLVSIVAVNKKSKTS